MKILSIGNFGHGWDGSICDEEHIASALEELEHEVTRFQREEQINSLATRWDAYDLTLIAQWDQFGEHFLTSLPRPLVYWAFDYQDDGQEWHEKLIAQADLYLSKRIADSKYPNWQWLSQDFAPSFLDKVPHPVEKDIDVLFTGSYLDWATERNETIKAVNEKFNLVVHSVNDWPFLERKPPMMDTELPLLYARAKVILSIDHTLEAGYHSDRVAQILCCGGFVLHRYIPMDEVSFHDNSTYLYNVIDCLDRVQYYLDEGEQREKIANKGYLYAQSNMKVINRVQDLIIIVESLLNEKNRTYSGTIRSSR